MITVLGIDPGTNNCAYAVTKLSLQPMRYEVVTHGMIKSPVKEMNGPDVGMCMRKFASEIRALKRLHRADFATAERYMTRGHGGTTIEAISAMLGIVATIFGTETRFIPAAVWKNSFNRLYDLKEFYEEMSVYGIPTHRVDAVCISLYGATLAVDAAHFEMLRNIKQFKKKVIQAR